MYNFFVNPWNFVAGAVLIAVPIIIHLINRLRFKRIPWAAMEFLLKAQKRMKRKLILQQLLLLLLRCLLMVLLGLMAARFLGFGGSGQERRSTQHLVVIDDSASMGDLWQDEKGLPRNGLFSAERVLLKQLLPAMRLAGVRQDMHLMRMSRPDREAASEKPEIEQKQPGDDKARDERSRKESDQVWLKLEEVGEGTEKKIEDYFRTLEPQPARGRLPEALRTVQKRIANPGGAPRDYAVHVHVLSDFRSVDWELDGPEIRELVRALVADGVKVHLIDVAHPYRKDDATDGEVPTASENVAITGLRPLQAAVPLDTSADFVLTVKNFGISDAKNLSFRVFVNGTETHEAVVYVATLGAQREENVRFSVKIAGGDPGAYKAIDPFRVVSVRLVGAESAGLVADNARHTIVEIRPTLKILAVDGRPNEIDLPTSDTFLLREIFTKTRRGFEWKNGTVSDLKGDLSSYSCVFLLNVPEFDPDAAAGLKKYVRDGGGVGIFLGPNAKPESYNALLYEKGDGLLPGRLGDTASPRLTDLEADARRARGAGQFVLRDMKAAAHDTLFKIYFNERGLEDQSTHETMQYFIDRTVLRSHWPVIRDTAYRANPEIRELYCFPNERRINEYTDEVLASIAELKFDKKTFDSARPYLTAAKAAIEDLATTTKPLPVLANAFDRLLRDQLGINDKAEKPLREFWQHPDNQTAFAKLRDLRDRLKFGDPIYIAKKYGRGRVTLITTTAGTGTNAEGWNDWATGMGGGFYRVVIEYMQQYLAGGGGDEVHNAGEPIAKALPKDYYENFYNLRRMPIRLKPDNNKEAVLVPGAVEPVIVKDKNGKETTNIPLNADGKEWRLKDNDISEPGAWFYTFWRKPQANLPAAAEVYACPVTFDAEREGNLRRMPRNDFTALAPGAELHSAGSEKWTKSLGVRRRDATEAGWIFLVLLAVLVAEQALATALSRNSASGPLENAPAMKAGV